MIIPTQGIQFRPQDGTVCNPMTMMYWTPVNGAVPLILPNVVFNNDNACAAPMTGYIQMFRA